MARSATVSPALRKWIVRAAGSATILGVIFWMVPREAIIEGFARIPPALFLAVFALFVAGHVVAAAKWWNILHRALRFPVALRAHFAGLTANLCLPGAAGGDTVRAAIAYASLRDFGKVAAGAAADRLIDMVALACLCLTGLALSDDAGDGGRMAVMALGLVLLAGLSVFYVLPWVLLWLAERFPRLPGHAHALNLAAALTRLGRAPGLLFVTLGISVLVQGGFIVLNYLFAKSVGVTVPLAAWAFAWALAKVIAVLPVSLGGLGLREATLAALLAPYGADAAHVVTAGLAWQAVLFLTGGLGGLVLTLSGAKLRPAMPVE